MPKFTFGICPKDGRYIFRVVEAPDGDAAEVLALARAGVARKECSLVLVDAEPEIDPEIEALFERARQWSPSAKLT
jgi:hypothetical protein